MHLRTRQTPKEQVKRPVHEQASNASKEAVITAFRKRIKELEVENRDLKRQVKVAFGLLAVHPGEGS